MTLFRSAATAAAGVVDAVFAEPFVFLPMAHLPISLKKSQYILCFVKDVKLWEFVVKGMVFNEFLNFVDAKMGPEMVDQIIDDCGDALSTGGAYTSVGTYPCSEMGALLNALVHRSRTPAPDLLRSFGKSLAVAFSESYRSYFAQAIDLFDFICRIDNYIHVEVLKLYPDAELPSFEIISKNDKCIVLMYRSPRALHDLATGLFLATAEHYGEKVDVAMAYGGTPGETTFAITRLDA